MLNIIENDADDYAPLLLVYGPAGIGKTTLALAAPNCLYIPVHPEAPPRNIKCKKTKGIGSFQEMMNTLRMVYKEQHGFATIVIDSLDALEPLVVSETCKRNNWKDIETPSYGKGWVENDTTWRLFISGIDAIRRNRGIMVIWLGLAEAINHEDPGTPPYKKYSLRLHKRGEKLVTQAADAVLFMNTRTAMKEVDTGFNQKVYIADGGGSRWINADTRPSFVAKNRFGMPDSMIIDKNNPWGGMEKYIQFTPLERTKIEPELPFTEPLTIPNDVKPVNPPPTIQELEKALGDEIPYH